MNLTDLGLDIQKLFWRNILKLRVNFPFFFTLWARIIQLLWLLSLYVYVTILHMEKDVTRGLVRRPQCEKNDKFILTINFFFVKPTLWWCSKNVAFTKVFFFQNYVRTYVHNFHTGDCTVQAKKSIFSPWFDASHFSTLCSDVFWRKKKLIS